MTIETSITIDEKVNGITCIVMDTDGRQNRAYAHIFVQCNILLAIFFFE